jgi:hypothetical protein
VVDGNHRVSVSRTLNIKTIFAHVYEFEAHITLDNNDDLSSIYSKWQAVYSGVPPHILAKGII